MNGIYNNFYLNAKVKFYKGNQLIHCTVKSIQWIQKYKQIYYLVVDEQSNQQYSIPQINLYSEYEEIKNKRDKNEIV